jgi:hypothetical protein
MEKVSTLNGTTEIYHASGEFTLAAAEKVKLDIANVKEFEEECPADHTWTVKVRISIIENPV